MLRLRNNDANKDPLALSLIEAIQTGDLASVTLVKGALRGIVRARNLPARRS
jgi:hypothetical protein